MLTTNVAGDMFPLSLMSTVLLLLPVIGALSLCIVGLNHFPKELFPLQSATGHLNTVTEAI